LTLLNWSELKFNGWDFFVPWEQVTSAMVATDEHDLSFWPIAPYHNKKAAKEQPVSARWYREYISELEMFGLVITAASGHGIRGNTRLIRLSFDAKKIQEALEAKLQVFSEVVEAIEPTTKAAK